MTDYIAMVQAGFWNVLTKEQRETWVKCNYFSVTTPDGLEFEIYAAISYNIAYTIHVNDRKVLVACICAQIDTNHWEMWMAQKTMLETIGGLDHILRVANVNINEYDVLGIVRANDVDTKTASLISGKVNAFIERARRMKRSYALGQGTILHHGGLILNDNEP